MERVKVQHSSRKAETNRANSYPPVTQLVLGSESGSARGRHGGARRLGRRQSAPLAYEYDPQLGAIVAAQQSTPHARSRTTVHRGRAPPPQQVGPLLLLSAARTLGSGLGARGGGARGRSSGGPDRGAGGKAPSGQGHKARTRAWGRARPGPAGRPCQIDRPCNDIWWLCHLT